MSTVTKTRSLEDEGSTGGYGGLIRLGIMTAVSSLVVSYGMQHFPAHQVPQSSVPIIERIIETVSVYDIR